MKEINADMQSVQSDMQELGSFGRQPDGGITRLAYSKEYDEAASLLCDKMRSAGLDVHRDGVGNIIGDLRGTQHGATLWIGSHLDTVIDGGLFDGLLGIVAGLEVVRMLKRSDCKLGMNLRIVAFQAEEGGELGGTFGSRAMMGLIDSDNTELGHKLERYGLTKEILADSSLPPQESDLYLELHIEQGGKLERIGVPIGIVTGIVAITRYELTFKGESNHAGTTEMCSRKDALVMLAEFINELNRLVLEVGDDMVATVGRVNLKPNMPNVIPGLAEASLEVRHMDQARIDVLIEQLETFCQKHFGSRVSFSPVSRKVSTPCDAALQNSLEKSCKSLGLPYCRLGSGAGHDANAMAHRMPIGMLFVPSKGGWSHCPQEDTAWQDIHDGIRVLFHTVKELDREYVGRRA